MKLGLIPLVLLVGLISCKPAQTEKKDLAVAKRGPTLPPKETSDVVNATKLDGLQFCPTKKTLNFANALWLTNIASLQYSHYQFAGPEMEKLGYGDPGEGQKFLKAWYVHRIKLINEKTKSKDDTWTNETERLSQLKSVQAKFKSLFASDYVDDGTSANAYENKLVTDPTNGKLQFLSGIATGKIFKEPTTQVMYAEHPQEKYSVIAFRGTEKDEVSDIVADLALNYLTLEEMGKVHDGFSSALDEVEPRLLTILKTRSSVAPVNLWITGHSLGGALATLFTAKIMLLKQKGELKNVNLLGTYTVGSPRVGNKDFARAFDTMAQKQSVTVVRFRNHADPVTTVPVGLPLIGGYWHVGSLAYVGGDGEIYFRDGWVEIETKSDLRDTFKLIPGEHVVLAYWQAIKKAYQANLGKDLSTCAKPASNVPPLPFYEDKSLRL